MLLKLEQLQDEAIPQKTLMADTPAHPGDEPGGTGGGACAYSEISPT